MKICIIKYLSLSFSLFAESLSSKSGSLRIFMSFPGWKLNWVLDWLLVPSLLQLVTVVSSPFILWTPETFLFPPDWSRTREWCWNYTIPGHQGWPLLRTRGPQPARVGSVGLSILCSWTIVLILINSKFRYSDALSQSADRKSKTNCLTPWFLKMKSSIGTFFQFQSEKC